MPNQIRTNPLGQIADSVVEQLKSSGSTAAKAVISEPAKILEQILGGKPQTGDPSGEVGTSEDSPSTSSGSSTSQADQALQLKKMEDEQKKQVLIQQYHQRLLQEDQQYYATVKRREEMEKKQKEEEDKQKAQIVQLQKEKENDEVWQQQLKAVQGSHEGQQGKM